MKKELPELEELGYISRHHGIHGEIVVVVPKPVNAAFEDVDFLFIELQGKPVPFPVEKIREQSKSTLLVKLGFIEDEPHARAFRECRIYIEKRHESPELKTETQKYAGFTLKDQESGYAGQVKSIMEIPGNPLLIVKFAEKEILVPLEASYILKIDEQNQEILAKLPEGLTAL